MNKAIRVIYIAMLLIALIFINVGVFFGNDEILDRSERVETVELQPSQVKYEHDGKIIKYIFDMSEQDSHANCLCFYTNHQYVNVYANGGIIYSLYDNGSTYGHTPGSRMNFVELPSNTLNLEVHITAAYDDVAGRSYTFTLGDTTSMYREYIISGVVDAILCLICVAVGVILIIYWLAFRRRLSQGPTVLYFGASVLMLGLWCLNETEFMMAIYPNRTLASYISYMLLMLIAIPFIQFIRKFFMLTDKYLCPLICSYSVGVFFVCTFLHMSGLVPFKHTAIYIQMGLVLIAVYMVYAIIAHWRRFGMDRLIKVNLVALVLMIVGLAADLAAYYIGISDTDIIGKICILAYIGIMSREIIRTFTAQIEIGRKAELYQEMATHDVMTGLLNRTAYEDFESLTEDFTDIMIVTFDLNELKKCNDTYGHVEGDKYLVDAANMIQRNFENIASCYRIGGDEFCAVIHRGSSVKIEHYFDRMERQEAEYNKLSRKISMHIAYGYAIFDRDNDVSIEATRGRADKMMYERKAAMKARA